MYKPKKQLGQNFIADKNVISRIVEVANISEKDTVLEIGPGQGSLTYALCQKAGKVIAVEKDPQLYDYLLKKFENIKNVEFVNEDILDFLVLSSKYKVLREGNYKIVANIPYYLTSFLLRKISGLENKPSEIIFMVQKEVAERMTAQKGKMNLLAVSVQMFTTPEILFHVSKNSFWPKPKVDSAVIRLRIKNQESLQSGGQARIKNMDEERFFDIIHAGFSAKRKLLVSNLSKGLGIPKEKICGIFKDVGISLKARAQDLSVEEWMEVYKAITQNSKLKSQK